MKACICYVTMGFINDISIVFVNEYKKISTIICTKVFISTQSFPKLNDVIWKKHVSTSLFDHKIKKQFAIIITWKILSNLRASGVLK
jgi:hypothetical protein